MRATSSRCGSSRPGRREIEPHQFGFDDVGGALTQSSDGRSDLGETLSREVRRKLTGNDGACGICVGSGGACRWITLQRLHVENGHTRQAGDGGIDVARQPEVADDEVLGVVAIGLGECAVHIRQGDHCPDRAGTGHHDICLRHRGRKLIEGNTVGVDAVGACRLCQVLGAFLCPVDDDDACDSGEGEMRNRQTAHRACTDNHGSAADQVRPHR